MERPMKKIILAGVVCLSLTSCGVKPAQVEGAGEKTYPDTRYDPMPGGGHVHSLPNGP